MRMMFRSGIAAADLAAVGFDDRNFAIRAVITSLAGAGTIAVMVPIARTAVVRRMVLIFVTISIMP